MHMADALLSPAVGAGMWAATAGSIAWCSAKVRRELDERKVPLMGVLGAFVFAAQMINFTIPATGSRITSYNVCYTKLLRLAPPDSASGVVLARSTSSSSSCSVRTVRGSANTVLALRNNFV